jgi:RHS repeat-associated protein
VIDDAGAVEAAYNYFPFGGFLDPPGAEGTALTYLFTGQELDRELSLYNFRARFYDSELGRFYATDPQRQFASPYVYGADNPILFIDPSGEIALGAILGITLGGLAVIGGAVLTIATGGGALPVEAGTVTAFVAEIAAATVGGAVLEAGTASVVYSATHPDDWNRKEFGISVGVAAGAGAFAGGFGVASGAISQAIGGSASVANRLGSSARARIAGQGTGLLLEGAAAGATNLAIQLAENSSSEGSLGSGLGEAFGLGLLGGALAIGGERAFDRGVDKLLTRRGISADKGLKAGLAIGAASGTLLGVPTNVVAQVITNAASGESVDSELLQAAALGAVSGVISGGIRAVGTYATQGSQGLGSAPGAPDLALQDFNPPPSIDSQTSTQQT